jgi:hypothetical protein
LFSLDLGEFVDFSDYLQQGIVIRVVLVLVLFVVLLFGVGAAGGSLAVLVLFLLLLCDIFVFDKCNALCSS